MGFTTASFYPSTDDKRFSISNALAGRSTNAAVIGLFEMPIH
jgi:hypothetical protein